MLKREPSAECRFDVAGNEPSKVSHSVFFSDYDEPTLTTVGAKLARVPEARGAKGTR